MAEKAMATHSSTLAWTIPWMEEPDRLQSMGLLRVRHDWANSLSLFTFMHWRRKWQPTPVFLPGESQGRGSLVCMRAPVYGVAQSWTRLMWLSSSSSSRGIWDLSSSTMDLLLSPAVESAQSLNYWTAREAPIYRDIYHGIFLKQRKGHKLNPQIGDWLKKLCFNCVNEKSCH